MLDSPIADRPMPGAAMKGIAPSYVGPERRSAPSLVQQVFTAMLDEVDYGLLLVTDGDRVLHANRAARSELDESHPLQLLGDQLRVRRPQDVAALRQAIDAACQRGLRKMLTLGDPHRLVCMAIVPLPRGIGDGPSPPTLLILGKQRVCEQLSIHWFARSHELTPAESAVLEHLCTGQDPTDIAEQLGVAISTVRTQVSSIRQKTGASNIRELVRKVAVLPPLLNALRV